MRVKSLRIRTMRVHSQVVLFRVQSSGKHVFEKCVFQSTLQAIACSAHACDECVFCLHSSMAVQLGTRCASRKETRMRKVCMRVLATRTYTMRVHLIYQLPPILLTTAHTILTCVYNDQNAHA